MKNSKTNFKWRTPKQTLNVELQKYLCNGASKEASSLENWKNDVCGFALPRNY